MENEWIGELVGLMSTPWSLAAIPVALLVLWAASKVGIFRE